MSLSLVAVDQLRRDPSSTNAFVRTSLSSLDVRRPIKPRTMAQAPIPADEIEDDSLLHMSTPDDITLNQKRKTFRAAVVDEL